MIKITSEKTTLEQNLERINTPLTLLENNVRSSIHNLNESFTVFWSLPDDQLEEVLNHKGYIEMERIFTAHNTYALSLNSLLEDRGIAYPRAITEKPRNIYMDEEGKLRLAPLPIPVTEPDPISE